MPKNKVNAGILLESNFGAYLSADYYYVGSLPMNDANTIYNDSYNLLNLKAGYRFEVFKGLASHLSAGVNNVTDTKYASMVLVNATGGKWSRAKVLLPGAAGKLLCQRIVQLSILITSGEQSRLRSYS